MKRKGTDSLLPFVQSFFMDHLRQISGAKENTVRSYRDSLRLFFLFLSDHLKRSIANLRVDDIRVEAVLKFLNHIESARGNSATTRNSRLAAIRSFVQHLLRHEVTRAQEYGRILSLPSKKTGARSVSYLEPEDVRALVGAVELSSPMSRRDRALLLVLYNTGARVAETLAIRPQDLQLQRPRQVRLFGKGGRERICPLWPETATALRELLVETDVQSDQAVFRNSRGAVLSRDGVAYLIDKYARCASKTRPTLRRRRITPHVLRHSCAVALLQAGVDLTVIRDYLGHASIATTNRYISTNLQMKRNVLQAFWKRAGLDRRSSQRWRPSPKLLAFLDSL